MREPAGPPVSSSLSVPPVTSNAPRPASSRSSPASPRSAPAAAAEASSTSLPAPPLATTDSAGVSGSVTVSASSPPRRSTAIAVLDPCGQLTELALRRVQTPGALRVSPASADSSRFEPSRAIVTWSPTSSPV